MSRILLTRNPSNVSLELPEPCLCVYHKDFQPILNSPSLSFQDFKADPRHYLNGLRHLVLVGLNRIVTPSNRTDLVFEILFNNTPELPKTSIDTTLFIGKPWRSWFHFGIVGAEYQEYTYSYIAESNYESFWNGIHDDDPFDLETIRRSGDGIVQSDYKQYFVSPTVQVIPAPTSVHSEYQRRKAELFDTERSISKILTSLALFAQESVPERSVPALGRFFQQQTSIIVSTDLGIDTWLVSELQRIAVLTNSILEAFYGNSGL